MGFSIASLSRALPQSPSAPAPSRREPAFAPSSAYTNRTPTNRLIGLWEFFSCCVFSVKYNKETEGMLLKMYLTIIGEMITKWQKP